MVLFLNIKGSATASGWTVTALVKLNAVGTVFKTGVSKYLV